MPRSTAQPILRAALIAVAALLATWLVACGGDDEGSSSTTTTSTRANDGPGPNPPEREPPLMGQPKVHEDVKQAVKRIKKTLASGDCDKINELNLLSRPALATERRCNLLKRFTELEVTGAVDYGKLGAVIAFQRAARTFNWIMVRDSDGLFHLAYFDLLTGPAGTEGKLDPQFEKVANKGTKALAKKNCKVFLKYANRRVGLGRSNEKITCARVKANLLARYLQRGGKPKPEQLAGGSAYAFWGVDTPGSYLTLVAAKLTGPQEGIPKDAPEYGIVDIYQTNPRIPITAPEDSGDGG
jgi:hypothetical protein